MKKEKLPIWLSDWTFVMPKTKRTYKAIDVFVKCYDVDEVINNPMLINKALSKINLRKNKSKLLVKSIDLKSQHGFGPKYD
tara:strand:- start:357 stop:599 length:243 start_codon:yes stop_codon:yes gene_type:complete